MRSYDPTKMYQVLSIDESSRKLLASCPDGRGNIETVYVCTFSEYGAHLLKEVEVQRLWPHLREDERQQIANTDVTSGRFD